jgi:peptidoglycan/xylan/chitin deacetylase (PgdA/CDA1 family)
MPRRWIIWLTGLLSLSLAPLLVLVSLPDLNAPMPTAAPATIVSLAPLPLPTVAIAPTSTPSPAPTLEPTPDTLRRAGRSIGYVPILMYHYVREVDAAADPLGYRLSVRPDRFAEQMEWLAANGYSPITVSELAACLRRERDCPSRPVVITFDDGYADQVLNALPVLQAHGFPATFYIPTGLIGRPGYVSWEQLELLRDSGMELGAHSVSHADLAALDLASVAREIVASRGTLERRLDIRVRSFSYPAGSYTPAVVDLVIEAGYTSAVATAAESRPSHLFELPRRRVLGGETIAGFPWYMVPASRQAP